VEPEPEIWDLVQGSYTKKSYVFSVFLDQIVLELGPKSQDVGARAKKIRCPEPEPEVCAPAPQPWLQVSHITLQHAKKNKHLFGVVFTSDQRQNKEIDTWIGKANVVPRELYHSVVNKRGAFKHHKVISF